jgi:hypothetical protein
MFYRTALVTSLALLAAPAAQAGECSMGKTLITDSLYGMAAGTVVGSLWMLAHPKETDNSDIVPNLATAALIGTGIGAVLGVVEVGLCAKEIAAKSEKPGFQTPALALITTPGFNSAETGMGLRLRYVMP